MRYVVAVSAPPGGGKTSLVGAIADRLHDATAIHYDSYEKATERPADEIVQWMKTGADCNELVVPGLPEDMARLKRGESVIDPSSAREIKSGKYILFETPFGREHRALASYIDLLIWIKVPLDIALARKIKEFAEMFLNEQTREAHTDCIGWLGGYLDNYLMGIRDTLKIQEERIGASADIVVDGLSALEAMAEHAAREILQRAP